MWWMMKAMIRCHQQLEEWRSTGFDGYMILQVHDELVFDFPAGNNLPKIRKLKRLMEQGGDDIGIPTPVSCERCVDNWSEGVSV
jgi:DNA polymerase I-like protein with 3'-5' exonuclease and polymerase domains